MYYAHPKDSKPIRVVDDHFKSTHSFGTSLLCVFQKYDYKSTLLVDTHCDIMVNTPNKQPDYNKNGPRDAQDDMFAP